MFMPQATNETFFTFICARLTRPHRNVLKSYMSTYYEILGLPEGLRNGPHLSAQTLRSAYRRALLQNHPDKATKSSATKREIHPIDDIAKAYSTLLDPKLRKAYDQELRLEASSAKSNRLKIEETFRTGIETIDLDDLDKDEGQEIWFRYCRCGEEQGFLIREADLEEAAEDGEISVGCRGCSLWLKVLFGVVEDSQAAVNDRKLHAA